MSSLWDGKKFSWEDIAYRGKSAFAVLLALAILVGGGLFVYGKAKHAWEDFRQRDDYIGEGQTPVVVTIPRGTSLYRVADILERADVIRSAKAFDIAVAAEPRASTIQAGKYHLKTKLPAAKALEMMLDPKNQIRNKVTVPEGLRLSAQIKLLSDKTGISVADFEAALKKPADYKLAPFAGGNPEGFLFPDTYEWPEGATATQVLTTMADRFTAVANDLALERNAASVNMNPRQLVIVGSLIEAEAGQPEDRSKIARVIYNRLSKDMPLQLDSTVKYVVGKDGKVTTTDAERETESPYNTYLNKGLPPGPINAPGRASMQAATAPAPGDWLYFVTVNLDTGETLFAVTREEHDQNVKKFQQWCQQPANLKKC